MRVEESHIIKLLAGSDVKTHDTPTYSNILNALISVIQRAGPGDLVYIHYSGHGGQTPTAFPMLKGKGRLDRVLVPTDIACGGQYLRDIEMAHLVRKMVEKGLVVTLVLDCESPFERKVGSRNLTTDRSNTPQDTPISFSEIVGRAFQDDGNTKSRNSSVTEESWLLEPQGYTLFAASRLRPPNEVAQSDGKVYGAFSYCLLNELQCNPTATISSRTLYGRVRTRIKKMGINQTPVLAGEIDRLFFGADVIPCVQAT
jgi:hypothetical protein